MPIARDRCLVQKTNFENPSDAIPEHAVMSICLKNLEGFQFV